MLYKILFVFYCVMLCKEVWWVGEIKFVLIVLFILFIKYYGFFVIFEDFFLFKGLIKCVIEFYCSEVFKYNLFKCVCVKLCGKFEFRVVLGDGKVFIC